MSEAHDMRAAAELLGALPDPAAEVELWRQLCREAYERGRAEGYRQGYERGARLLEAEWPSIAAPAVRDRPDHAELERRRWSVYGEPRTRETFGQPHQADRAPRSRRETAA